MKSHFIHGRFTAGHATAEIAIHNPATEELIDRAPLGTARDIDDAVRAASTAFADWKRLPAVPRAEVLHEVSRKIRAHFEELARLLTDRKSVV